MKRILLFLLLMASIPIAMMAYDVEVDGIYYNLVPSTNTAEVAAPPDESKYSGDVVIPATFVYGATYDVTSIGDDAFSGCTGLTSISIPSSVTKIGECAFYDCSNLTSINIPSSVTNIGYAAFAECTSLPVENGIRYADTYLVDVLDNSLTDYQIKEGTRFIGDYTFYQNPNLTSITIPNSVISIGAYVFSQCVNLASINIPSSVIKIGGYAISECTNLTSINIPDNVTSIGDGAFSGCTSLPVVDNIRYADTYLVEAVDKTLTTYNIKQGTRFIGTDAFSGCTNLSSITIPNGVTRFGFWSFNECTSLESITIPSSTNHIETSAFRACSSLSSISIPSSVTYIGGNPFEGCYNLTSIIVDSNNPLYDSRNNCNAIIHTASNELISGCKNTIIPNDVTRLGGNAFAGIKGVSIDIPESVTEIDGGAFAFLESSINTVVCRAATPPTLLIPDVFCDTDIANATLMVPATSIDAYRAAEIWKDFGTITSLSTVVTANSYEREYGDENPTFDWTEEGAQLDGSPFATCAATETSAPGEYDIVITRGTETNTDVTYVNGTLTITKAPLTITAKSYTIIEGESLPTTFELEYEGFKNNETESDIDLTNLTISCEATDGDTPGTYNITVSGAASDNYDITFVDGTLTVNPASSGISITAAGMGTYCSPYDLDFSNVTDLKAYIITGYDWQSKKVYATRVYDVPAGTGLYLVGNAGDYDIPTGNSTSYYINMLVGVLTDTWIEPTDGDMTNLRLTGSSPSNASFKILTQGRNFSANRAYLQIPTSVLSNSAFAVGIIFDDETDGIESIGQDTENTNNEWFIIDGRKLNGKPTAKGVYVVKGRKIVVK